MIVLVSSARLLRVLSTRRYTIVKSESGAGARCETQSTSRTEWVFFFWCDLYTRYTTTLCPATGVCVCVCMGSNKCGCVCVRVQRSVSVECGWFTPNHRHSHPCRRRVPLARSSPPTLTSKPPSPILPSIRSACVLFRSLCASQPPTRARAHAG